MNDDAGNFQESMERWRKPMQWVVGMFLIVFGYVMVYPALYMLIVVTTGLWEGLPKWFELSIAPLEWLHREVPLYERYIDWLGNRIF